MTSKTPPAAPTKTVPAKPPKLKLERVFDATPERLWEQWTDPTRYAKWMNPGKADLKIQTFEVRVGGKVAFFMPLDNGQEMPNSGVFHVLDKPRRLVSGAPDKSFLIDVTFTPVGTKQTRMTVVMDGVPSEHHTGATAGWGACFDKLAKRLEA